MAVTVPSVIAATRAIVAIPARCFSYIRFISHPSPPARAGVSYCAGAFVPFTLNTIQGGVSLRVILNIFDQPRKNEGNPTPWRSLQAKEQRAHSRNEPAPPRPRAPTPPTKRPRCCPFPCFSNFGARIFLAPSSNYIPRNFRISGSAIWGALSSRRSRASTTHLSRPSRTIPTRSASRCASTKS